MSSPNAAIDQDVDQLYDAVQKLQQSIDSIPLWSLTVGDVMRIRMACREAEKLREKLNRDIGG